MIYIEVIFGSINGNAITVDSAMSNTSTNPVQNKVIKAALDALQRNIDAVAGSITKDVVEVETYDDLAEIEEPNTEVIYVTTDTNKLYLYDAENDEFNEVTNTAVDNTIYVTDLDDLFDMDLSNGLYTVSYSHRIQATFRTDIYSLSVQSRSRRAIGGMVTVVEMCLANADGYAVKGTDDNNDPVWVWTMYSVEGHTHTTSDIDGLSDALAAKQNASDNSLNTTDKTVVGAINELHTQMTNVIESFIIDFQKALTNVQMRNLMGAIKITKIACDNVSTLKVKINGTVTNLTSGIVNGVWEGTPLAIPADALLEWEIARASGGDGNIASISVKYQFNS